MEKEKVPDDIMNSLKTWRWQARALRVVHIILGLAAVVTSITVASRLIGDNGELSFYAWIAAISTGILTSLGLETKSNNMRNAWRILNIAVLRYKTEEYFTMKQLIDAYDIGEKIIGDVTITLE